MGREQDARDPRSLHDMGSEYDQFTLIKSRISTRHLTPRIRCEQTVRSARMPEANHFDVAAATPANLTRILSSSMINRLVIPFSSNVSDLVSSLQERTAATSGR